MEIKINSLQAEITAKYDVKKIFKAQYRAISAKLSKTNLSRNPKEMVDFNYGRPVAVGVDGVYQLREGLQYLTNWDNPKAWELLVTLPTP